MRFILAALAVLGLAGCSSAPKEEGASATAGTTVKRKKTVLPVIQSKEAAAAEAQAAKLANVASTECKKANETKTLAIQVIQPRGCELWYDTNGANRKKIATSTQSNAHCEKVLANVKGNLESANYVCTDQ